jgi:hypothetical protein
MNLIRSGMGIRFLWEGERQQTMVMFTYKASCRQVNRAKGLPPPACVTTISHNYGFMT